jgi:serine/threonine-protein kinase
MTIMANEGIFVMSAPDKDTTKLAYGGKLRRYDVHIAKMFEVTHYMCQENMLAPSATWVYRAGNGSIEMGTFEVSCKLANDLAIAYGLHKPENTLIQWFHDESNSITETSPDVPVLDITPKKSDRWMSFTRHFKPAQP